MRFFRDPLIHFVVGGAALFGVIRWLSPEGPHSAGDGGTIHIGSGEIAWMQETWTTQWQRPGTRDEIMGAVTNYLKEELLAREARSLGMEKDDTMVRRRLAQKMSFLLEDTFRRKTPTDAELSSSFEAQADRYALPPRVTFEQVYFDPEKRQDAAADAKSELAELIASGAAAAPEEAGDRTLLERRFAEADPASIDAQFGEGFAKAVIEAPAGAWSGPLKSAYGVHLVRVESVTPPRARGLDEVRARVEDDWYLEQQRKEIAAYFAKLMDKYQVEIEPDVRGMVGPLDELLPQMISGPESPR